MEADERTAFRLFAADRLLDAGVTPDELLSGLGFEGWPITMLKAYHPDEPRIPAGQAGGGQWTTGEGDSLSSGDILPIVVGGSGRKDLCIERCYHLLERPLPHPGSDINTYDFWKCINDCMAERG